MKLNQDDELFSRLNRAQNTGVDEILHEALKVMNSLPVQEKRRYLVTEAVIKLELFGAESWGIKIDRPEVVPTKIGARSTP